MGRHSTFAFRILSAALLLLMLMPGSQAQTDPPIPAGKIRIHYFRPDGNYLGWTVYAFGDTTENIADFKGGPVKVTGQDNFGAYFDVGVTSSAQNVSIVIHKGNIKDPGPDVRVDPAAEGSEYWQLSGSNVLQRTRPPTIQQTDPPIPSGKARIHYHRPDNDYANWNLYPFLATADPTGDFCNTVDYVAGYDAYGAYFDVGINPSQFNGQLGFIIHNCGLKDPGPDMHLQIDQHHEAWALSGNATVFLSQPVTEYVQDPVIPPNTARIHYFRPDGNYTAWTVYAFNDTTEDTGNFGGGPVFVTGYDTYGAFFDVGLKLNPHDLGFVVHNLFSGTKDPGLDMHLDVVHFNQAWVISGDAEVFTAQPSAAQLLNAVFFKQQAYWIDRTTVAIQSQYLQSGWRYFLSSDLHANLQLTATGVIGGASLQLSPFTGLPAEELSRFPQLSGYAVLHLPTTVDINLLKTFLRGQLALSAVGSDGALKYATGVQIPGVLDDIFYYPGKLGVVFRHHSDRDARFNRDDRDADSDGESNDGSDDWSDDRFNNKSNDRFNNRFIDSDASPVSVKVWAPTAQSVQLQLFDQAGDTSPIKVIPMHERNGVWTAQGDESWKGKYYLFDLKVYVPSLRAIVENVVTDPYSIDLGLNGIKSRITDFDEDETMPAGWRRERSPRLESKGDLSIYELHIRDFSEHDLTVPAQLRGTYLAFADPRSNGMKHLEALADAGLKAVHLLPSFHFASINEDKNSWVGTPDLSVDPPDGTQQQTAVAAIKNSDGFNWGYDPIHYFAPEGGYAVNPDDRVREYRAMVQGLHRSGLRVIQDVVFNHTSASGEGPLSVLDEVVPGYYHRLDGDGNQQNGSCCPDTASEHRMMEKLMIDVTVWNAKEYKIDGFRFDLMSFHLVSNMQHIQQALSGLTPEREGVDGGKIYLYGEGFDFGEVANNAIGINASQANLFGNGIGSFNDRIRDGIRGGSPFTDGRVQGFATGLFTASSDFTNQNQIPMDQLNTLLEQTDWIEVGLAGNLRHWTFTDHTGTVVTGSQVNYNGQQAGYTASPSEAVNYCSVHDNQTLFDAMQLKSPLTDAIEKRVRRQLLAMSLVALGQGVPFFLAGDDLLRSKDMDANSFNSGDWFNQLDFSYQSNNWGTGLPLASENQSAWPVMQPLLANPALKPSLANIERSRDGFRDLLEIRDSSDLFRMKTLREVQANLHFLNTGPSQTPGLIVMKLDSNGSDYGVFKHLLVVFNAGGTSVKFQSEELKGLNLRLHPVHNKSTDSVVRQSLFDNKTGVVNVPALTTAVFVGTEE